MQFYAIILICEFLNGKKATLTFNTVLFVAFNM